MPTAFVRQLFYYRYPDFFIHAYYQARTLGNHAYGRDRLSVALASSEVGFFPFQVAAALFTMPSPFIKGAVLCDDGSLGKAYEALLVLSQRWHEGRRRTERWRRRYNSIRPQAPWSTSRRT